jgi:hypothetical protein
MSDNANLLSKLSIGHSVCLPELSDLLLNDVVEHQVLGVNLMRQLQMLLYLFLEVRHFHVNLPRGLDAASQVDLELLQVLNVHNH